MSDPACQDQEGPATPPPPDGQHARVSHRSFLKGLAAALGGAGTAQLLVRGEQANATYTAGAPDVVDTNLAIQGNLTVGGEVRVGSGAAIGSDGIAKVAYYAGDVIIPPAGTATPTATPTLPPPATATPPSTATPTPTFTPTPTPTPYPSGSLAFNGTDGRVDHGDVNAMDAASALTVMAWVRPATLATGNGAIIGKANPSNYATDDGFVIQRDNSTSLRVLANTGSTWAQTTLTGVFANTTDWVHVTWVFDGSRPDNAGRSSLYVNGTAGSPSYAYTVPAQLRTNAYSLQVGHTAQSSSWWGGEIARLKVWTAALTASEVQAEMPSRLAVRTTNLVLAAPYDDGTQAQDLSGNANHGTIYGGVTASASPPPTPTPLPTPTATPLPTATPGGVVYTAADLEQTPWPQGTIAWWGGSPSSIPTGWEIANGYFAQNDSAYLKPGLLGKYLRGIAAGGAPGADSPGSGSHYHTLPPHTHTTSAGNNDLYGEGGCCVAPSSHLHTLQSSTEANYSSEPHELYNQTALPIVFTLRSGGTGATITRQQLTADALPPLRTVAAWTGSVASVPAGWTLCDGQSANGLTTPNFASRFLKGIPTTGSATGATGGSESHTHTDTHSHGTTSTENNVSTTSAGSGTSSTPHTHTTSAANLSSTSSSHLPPHMAVAWLMFTGHGTNTAAGAGATIGPAQLDPSLPAPRGLVIASATNAASAGWQHCDGGAWSGGAVNGYGGSRPNLLGRYVKHTTTPTESGGTSAGPATNSHHHTGARHGHVVSGSGYRGNNPNPDRYAAGDHTHTVPDVDGSTNEANHEPPYATVAYLVRD